MSEHETLPPPMPSIAHLLARGREAHEAWLVRTYRPEDRPMGADSISRVRLDDFVDAAEACVAYVLTERPALFVLSPTGQPIAILERASRP